ncbi:MAG: hypothetical protein K0U41_06330 [Gammaproteobacteria bacterium]|nr:hypothetical protein [Gammaproteobacteria bacterium]
MIEPTEENHNTIRWLQDISSGNLRWSGPLGSTKKDLKDSQKMVAKCSVGIFVITEKPKPWFDFFKSNNYTIAFEPIPTKNDSFYEQAAKFIEENAVTFRTSTFFTLAEAQVTILYFIGTIYDHISIMNAKSRLDTYAADMAKLEKLQKLLNKTP